MDVQYERCCGIDVHKRIIVACLKCGKKLLKQSLLMLQYSLENCDQGYVLFLQQHQQTTAQKA